LLSAVLTGVLRGRDKACLPQSSLCINDELISGLVRIGMLLLLLLLMLNILRLQLIKARTLCISLTSIVKTLQFTHQQFDYLQLLL
jgi:hypothetical protein